MHCQVNLKSAPPAVLHLKVNRHAVVLITAIAFWVVIYETLLSGRHHHEPPRTTGFLGVLALVLMLQDQRPTLPTSPGTGRGSFQIRQVPPDSLRI